MSKLPNHVSQTGFTLIEMLVTVSIGLMMISIGIVGYLDFNARQKILGAAKELETIFQTAQTKARSGDLAGCTQLFAYQVTFDTGVDPILGTVTPLCSDGSTGLADTYALVSGVTMTTSPALVNLRFPAINGGVIFNPTASEVDFTLATDSISQTYQITIARAGDVSEGGWQ